MKKALIGSFLMAGLMSINAHAALWNVWTCENGALKIDAYTTGDDADRAYQIVIRDEKIKKYFNENGFSGNKTSSRGDEVIYESLSLLSNTGAPTFEFSDGKLNVMTYLDRGGIRVSLSDESRRGSDGKASSVNWLFHDCQRSR